MWLRCMAWSSEGWFRIKSLTSPDTNSIIRVRNERGVDKHRVISVWIHIHIHMCTCIYMHTYICTLMHTLMHTPIPTNLYTHGYICINMDKHIQTCKCKQWSLCPWSPEVTPCLGENQETAPPSDSEGMVWEFSEGWLWKDPSYSLTLNQLNSSNSV